MNMSEQQLPVPLHSIEAEHAILGTLMRFNEGFGRLGDLQAKHFTVLTTARSSLRSCGWFRRVSRPT